jgi:hypothetical protein
MAAFGPEAEAPVISWFMSSRPKLACPLQWPPSVAHISRMRYDSFCERVSASDPGGSEMSRRRKSTTTSDYAANNALTWMFAGLTVIALVAGLIAQIVS